MIGHFCKSPRALHSFDHRLITIPIPLSKSKFAPETAYIKVHSANDNDVVTAVFVMLKVAWLGQDSGKYEFLRLFLGT
jgi:hypothetical protein